MLRILRVAIAVGLVGTGVGMAQQPTESAAPEPAVAARPELATAQETVRTFFRAFRLAREGGAGDPLQEAVDTLDLSAIPNLVRNTKGRELAVQLKDVLDRTERIDVEAIPSLADGPPHVLVSRPQGDVIVARRADGHWRFTAATVARIPAMAEAVAAEGTVEGVQEASRSLSPSLWLRSKMPPLLLGRSVLLENWQWLGLLVLVLLGLLVDRLATSAVAAGWSVFFARRTPERLDRKVALSTARPIGLLAMTGAWAAGLPWLGLPPGLLATLQTAITFLLAAGVVWAAYRLVNLAGAFLEAKAKESATKSDDILVPLLRKAAKVLIAVFGVVFVAESLDVPIGSLLAGVGLSGLALALAAQDAIKNLFGSILVVLDRPFEVGDWVQTSGVEGVVTELGFRSTRIRTANDSLVTLPNANFISAAVDNLGKRNYRRWKTTLALTYDTPTEKIEAFCEGIRELIRNHPKTRKESFHVHFNAFGDSSLDVLLNVYFAVPSWDEELAGKHELGILILELAESLGVEFAFPTRTVHAVPAE